MTELKIKQIAWVLPVIFFIHLLEELYGGAGFPEWFSDLFNTEMTIGKFLTINSIGLLIFIFAAISVNLGKGNLLLLIVLSTLLFFNGIIHVLITILTLSYSPGTVSGFLLYIPFGIVVYNKVFPVISYHTKMIGVASGILLHVMVTLIALHI